jgi:Na+/H+ antiporter NhaC
MSSVLECEKKIGNEILKMSLFQLYNEHLVITFKDKKQVFNLSEIRHLRIKKQINYFIYIFFVIFLLLFYYLMTGYFESNILFLFFLFTINAASIIANFSLQKYTYVLYMNTSSSGTIKFSLPKKYVDDAFHLISILQSGYLRKYKE